MSYAKLPQEHMREIFERYGHKKTYSVGQIVVERDAPATKIAFLAKGQLRSHILSENGEEITLFYLSQDTPFCYESLFAHPTVLIGLDAFTDAEVYTMYPNEFFSAWAEAGYSERELLALLVKRILLLSNYLCCARFTKSKQRLAYFLYFMYAENHEPIVYTHEQLAEMIGMSKVSIDRILKKLEKDKVISCKYRKIIVTDENKLIACFNSLDHLVEDK